MSVLGYRCWGIKEKQYLKLHSIHLSTKKVIVSSFGRCGGNISLLFDRVILEQYTGLLDRNGKEIYEGDVIKMPPELCYEQDETTGVVEFSHGSFYVKDKQFSDGAKYVVDFYDFNDPEVEFEVIGNIHENPELL